MLPTRDSPQVKRHKQTENKEMGKDFHKKKTNEKAGVVILITDKLDFKSPESTQQFHFSVFI